DAFLFVLGDHGHRFDSIRRTTVGRIEERFPFFSMHIPRNLQRKFPRLNRIVNENTQVLTSFWDFYATMQDIRQLSSSNKWKLFDSDAVATYSNSDFTKGLSLLRPIKDRNCKEAGIPKELCTCRDEITVDINEAIIWQLSNEIILHLNNLLKSSRHCAKLTLARILHATVIDNDDEVGPVEVHYRITIEARPSGGLFEALLKHDRVHNTSIVYRNVNRVNAYGNQSLCVHEQELRKVCYCN
ncbi:hypothetical protein GCK32_015342, partial [Trichostrongylus colubriformis]